MQKTIYLVDDSSTIRALYKTVLESVGYKVLVFKTGSSCLSAILEQQPDLILMGAELPDTNCIELATKIKTHPENLLVPLIVISSTRSIELRKDCFQAGITDFILKTCTQNFLIERIKLILQRNETMQFNQHLLGQRFNVLIAEDSAALLTLYGHMFEQMGCSPVLCKDGDEAWKELQKRDDIDLVLTDIEMPNMDGRELNHLIRSRSDFDQIPVIVVTRYDQQELLSELLTAGANDYISKPFIHEELQARVSSHLRTRQLYKDQQRLNKELKELNGFLEDRVRERTQELHDANIETITKLAKVCDYKDLETGNHINRVKAYSEELGRAIGLSSEIVNRLGYSSMMHDLGKITTPDRILNKPGSLDEYEWVKMREHSKAGADLLGEKQFFTMAREIALYHHERMDGNGYPKGLKGQEIPLSARIVAVVDVYDALVSKRSYKEAWSQEEAIAELQRISDLHLDKRLVDVFVGMLEKGELEYIRKLYPETTGSSLELAD